MSNHPKKGMSVVLTPHKRIYVNLNFHRSKLCSPYDWRQSGSEIYWKFWSRFVQWKDLGCTLGSLLQSEFTFWKSSPTALIEASRMICHAMPYTLPKTIKYFLLNHWRSSWSRIGRLHLAAKSFQINWYLIETLVACSTEFWIYLSGQWGTFNILLTTLFSWEGYKSIWVLI
jgi:hypothetical protein